LQLILLVVTYKSNFLFLLVWVGYGFSSHGGSRVGWCRLGLQYSTYGCPHKSLGMIYQVWRFQLTNPAII